MNIYHDFVVQARAVNFTYDQLDFIWDWLLQVAEDPKAFLDPDNYVPSSPQESKEASVLENGRRMGKA